VITAHDVYFVQAEIQLPTIEITGIACTYLQLATAYPVKWIRVELYIKYLSLETKTKKTFFSGIREHEKPKYTAEYENETVAIELKSKILKMLK